MKKSDIQSLYYITHWGNIKSILEKGILSNNTIQSEGIKPKVIYDKDVISIRKKKKLPNNDNLSDYANLYFQPRNPMLYRVLHSKGRGNFNKGTKNIVIIEIKKDILDFFNVFIATSNAATQNAEFFNDIDEGLGKIDKIVLNDNAWWNDLVDGKSKIMAEVLVKNRIPVNYILSIYTANEDTEKKLKNNLTVSNHKIDLILDKVKFFLPNNTISINDKIKLVQGDMFFSTAQTMTISVNTVAIMGKGLASRTRYQFPDIFVEYQDLCRSKKLKMGKPCLLKREKSIDEILAYDPDTLKNKNFSKWFLLFPTKNHWKNDSDFKGIEQGLKWLVKEYKKLGIKSIALPALGCGLGKLSWSDLGPLMCKYLNQMDIQSIVYLPLEKQKIPEEQLTLNFLISNNQENLKLI